MSLDQVDVAQKEHRHTGTSFEESLLSLGFISEGALAEALACMSGYERVNLEHTLFDATLKSLIPREIAERYSFIPLSLEEGVLRVALADVYNLQALDFLRHKISTVRDVIPLIAPESDILEAIDRYYGYDLSIRGLLKEVETSRNHLNSQDDRINPTIRLVNAILMDAIKRQASDIHFEPEGAFMRLRYRIDGILAQVCTLHSSSGPRCACVLR